MLRLLVLLTFLTASINCAGYVDGELPGADPEADPLPSQDDPGTAPQEAPGTVPGEPPGEGTPSQDPTTSADTEPPSAPGIVSAVADSSSQISLAWGAATDNVSVAAYLVFRDGTEIATLQASTRTFIDSARAAGTSYAYLVRGRDAAGNVGPASNTATATTTSNLPTWPDATNTGVPADAVLTASGSMVVTQANQVIEKKDIRGSILVKANNVTIRRCRIMHTSTVIELQQGFSNLTIEDVTIVGTMGQSMYKAIIANGDITLRRLNVSGFTSGVLVLDHGGLIEDSYFHDMENAAGKGGDVIEAWAAKKLVIRHNRLEMSGEGNSSVKLPLDVPAPGGDDVLIENNIIAGGGYALIAGYDPVGPKSYTNVRVTNNRFSTQFHPKAGYYGPAAWVQSSLASGNVWHETGAALNL